MLYLSYKFHKYFRLTLALAMQRYIYVCHADTARVWCTMGKTKKAVAWIFFFAVLHQMTRFAFSSSQLNNSDVGRYRSHGRVAIAKTVSYSFFLYNGTILSIISECHLYCFLGIFDSHEVAAFEGRLSWRCYSISFLGLSILCVPVLKTIHQLALKDVIHLL